MNKKGAFQFFLVTITYLILLIFQINGILDNQIGLSISKALLLTLYTIVTIYAVRKFGMYSSWSLFLYAFFLFNLSRFFLDIIGFASINYSDKYVFYEISSETIMIILNSYVVFLITFLFSMVFTKKNRISISFNNSIALEKYSAAILLITSPFVAVKLINDVIGVLSSSYFSLYSSNSSTFRLLSPFWFIFYFTVPVYLSSMPKKRFKNAIIFIIFIVIVLDSLKGSRGALFRPILFLVWYYSLQEKQLSIRTAIPIIALTPIISNLYVYFREGGFIIRNFFSSFYTFLYSQGVTTIFFANYLDFRDGFSNNSRVYFLSGIIEPLRRYVTQRGIYNSGRTQSFVEATSSLDHKLMYELSPDLYQRGVGFGSNIVTEFYAFAGYLGIIILTIFLCLLINYFEKMSRKSRPVLVVAFYWIQNLIWSPRGTMFPNPIFIILSLTIFYFIMTFFNKRTKAISRNEGLQ